MERLRKLVGARLTYTPIAQVGSGHNAWRIDGSQGRGLLLESDDGAQPGGTFRTRSVFIGHSWSTYPMMVGTLAAHGWDAGVAAEQGEPIPKMSDKRRYKLRDERTAEVAARRDAAAWAAWDPTDRSEPAGGFPVQLLVELMNRFVMAAPPPSVIERNEGYIQAFRAGAVNGGGAEPSSWSARFRATGRSSPVRPAGRCSASRSVETLGTCATSWLSCAGSLTLRSGHSNGFSQPLQQGADLKDLDAAATEREALAERYRRHQQHRPLALGASGLDLSGPVSPPGQQYELDLAVGNLNR